MARAALALALLATTQPASEGWAAPDGARTVGDGRFAMGTALEITLVVAEATPARPLLDVAFAEAERLERLFTRYQPESALSLLNAAAGGPPRRVEPELAAILRRAVAATEATRGAFDVTVGPVVALWVESAARDRPPSADELAAARRRVGARRIAFDDAGRVALPEAGMSVDLGGIAKGWAADRLSEQLRAAGALGSLVSFGQSSVRATGAPPGEPGWRLALRGRGGELGGTVVLRDCAFSVSSSLGQWSEIGGRRYGHVVDPRSGEALTRTAQAAVIAPDGATAEVWSTALLVLPPEEGIALVEAVEGTEARLLLESGGELATPGWQPATGFEPLPSGH